ncbi:MAG: hypothetical protein NTW09_04030 [Candidatus Omnitrophica bacterium]|nr:hypothetical protein [Candidatus Omnitrophota bacterium]
MIINVMLSEEIVITTINKVGLLADISVMLANEGINIEAAVGYEIGRMAKLMLVTNANLKIVAELKRKRYKSVKETEVLMVELENKPGALKVVTTELKANKIDIKHLYVTTSAGEWSRMIIQTSDNETAMALLNKYAENAAK